ncbi:uncharacterized protein EV422DRAFT_544051 [Fimicolochytrium jonesii]|uniref:uncharacterized protein n=1 Tax=Fimicolochytrium jonesii TaxID=1396493 RepID=UPI0022FEE179|nr:uncharacterized protein EV422DRAFT_544051 [Fimicolochytrium jonesii]KAI8816808.1 hypothetical protein EV422DRAFT_544051 [Fimicolochytrium jonesii]
MISGPVQLAGFDTEDAFTYTTDDFPLQPLQPSPIAPSRSAAPAAEGEHRRQFHHPYKRPRQTATATVAASPNVNVAAPGTQPLTSLQRKARRPRQPVSHRKPAQATEGETEIAAKRLKNLEAVIREHLGTGKFFLVAAALRQIDEEKLYGPVFKTIYTYAKENFSFSRRTTNTYLCSASVYESLVEDPNLPVPVNISHIRSLHKFPADVRRFIWKRVCESGHTITEEHVVAMTVKYETGISFSDLNNELYTPKDIITAAKQVINKVVFDLDPASCEFANDKIHEHKIARQFFDENADGLLQPWTGDVWLSPPVGHDTDGTSQQSRWFCAAEQKYRLGEISSAMVLLKVDFGTAWFQKVLQYPHCFFFNKLCFSTPTGREKCVQDESHVLVYLGPNADLFCTQFLDFGNIPGWNSWPFKGKDTKDNILRDLLVDEPATEAPSAPCTPEIPTASFLGSQTSASPVDELTRLMNVGPEGVCESSESDSDQQFNGFLQNFVNNQFAMTGADGHLAVHDHHSMAHEVTGVTTQQSAANAAAFAGLQMGLGFGDPQTNKYHNMSYELDMGMGLISSRHAGDLVYPSTTHHDDQHSTHAHPDELLFSVPHDFHNATNSNRHSDDLVFANHNTDASHAALANAFASSLVATL